MADDYCIVLTVEHYFHSELDRGRLKIAPDTDLILARLLSEAKYQMDRLKFISNPPIGSTAPSIRPPFTLFYESLERLGAIFRLFGTVQMPSLLVTRIDPIPQAYKLHGVDLDDPRRATVFYREENPALRDSMLPALPPILVPVSMNLLIYASKDRIEIGSPAPTAVYEETSVSPPLLPRDAVLLTGNRSSSGSSGPCSFLYSSGSSQTRVRPTTSKSSSRRLPSSCRTITPTRNGSERRSSSPMARRTTRSSRS